jgi:hypothetical protein
MDTLIKDLQNVFGKTPISILPNAIVLKNKKTQTIILLAGTAIILGGIAYYAYKKGKESREEDVTDLRKQLREMKLENDKLASIQLQKSNKRAETLKTKMAPADAVTLEVISVPEEEIISEHISVPKSTKVDA